LNLLFFLPKLLLQKISKFLQATIIFNQNFFNLLKSIFSTVPTEINTSKYNFLHCIFQLRKAVKKLFKISSQLQKKK
jgi:hypothetical protein